MAGRDGRTSTGDEEPPDSHAEPGARESISMLNQIVEQALDDGYAEAAKNPEPPPRGVGLVVRRTGFVVSLLLLGLMLVMAFLQARAAAPEEEKEKQQLAQRVAAETSRVDKLHEKTRTLQEKVDRQQDRALASTESGKDLQNRNKKLELLVGVAPVEGSGVEITVDDAPKNAVENGDAESGRILDVDLQHIVNGLWAAGAEAIAINGQRLTALTAIRGADRAITVDYRPLARPYIVRAIGDPKTLQARFIESTGGEWVATLQTMEKIRYEIGTKDELELPADTTAQLRYARTEGGR